MCTIGPDVLSAFLNEFRTHHRDVLLILHDIEPRALSKLLLTGSLDVAFIGLHEKPGREEISASPLFEEDMVVAFAAGHRFGAMKEVSLFDVAEETYIDRLNCEIRQPFDDFTAESDLDLHVACSSPREDWIQAMVMRGLGVSVMPQFSIITQRIGWRKLVGSLSNCRQISIARAEGLSPQPSAEEFFSDATEFQWQYALDALEKRAGLS